MQEYIKERLTPLYVLQCMKGKRVFSNRVYLLDPEYTNSIMMYVAMQDKGLLMQL